MYSRSWVFDPIYRALTKLIVFFLCRWFYTRYRGSPFTLSDMHGHLTLCNLATQRDLLEIYYSQVDDSKAAYPGCRRNHHSIPPYLLDQYSSILTLFMALRLTDGVEPTPARSFFLALPTNETFIRHRTNRSPALPSTRLYGFRMLREAPFLSLLWRPSILIIFRSHTRYL